MKKRLVLWALVLALCLVAAVPAMAANVFRFTEKTINLYEGETVQAELLRDGSYAGDGEIEFLSSKQNIATVSRDGVITAITKGSSNVQAVLKRNGRQVGKAAVLVNVLRRVTKVTLNTTKLSVYEPDEPAVASMLKEPTDHRVLVVPAGGTVSLAATCTPTDASNLKVTFTASDAGVVRVTGAALKALQRGECDLTVASVQDPEVTETFRVLVIQPVKKITVDAGDKKVAVGARLQLKAVCAPDNASITAVTWTSKTPAIATVDENGVVTGLKKGYANIVATAADGSNIAGTVTLTVTQPAEAISFTNSQIEVTTGKTVSARYSVLPADTTDKTVSWSTSDPSVATVRNGQVTGVKAGTCLLTATSNSNPEVYATATVVVSQLVSKVECANAASELSIKVGEYVQTRWTLSPDDATNKGLTFRTNAPKVATVDENGMVKAIGRGVATITAQAKDSGRRQGYARVTVIQPVTGVSMQYPLYYVQRGGYRSVRAICQPRNANNQKIIWSSMDESVATIKSNGTSTGSVHGVYNGTTTITGYTEDGGFTANATIKVANFNGAVMVEELFVDANNKIRITMRNMSRDITLANVHYVIECFDMEGKPFICNKDGESMTFEGNYPHTLYPMDRTAHGAFNFKDYVIDRPLGAVALTVTSWKDSEGVTWTIPESERIRTTWTRLAPVNNNNNQGPGVG